MSSQFADPHEHDTTSGAEPSSPIPAQWIPWIVIAMAVALIAVAFLIPVAFAP